MKSSLVRVLVFSSLFSVTGSALAKERGFELGLRTGYAVPFGKISADQLHDLREGVSGTIPIWLDLGYRLTPHFSVGVFGQFAPGFLGDFWDSSCERRNGNCSVRDIRAGVEMQYHLLPQKSVDPWVAVGAGFEWLVFSTSAASDDVSLTARGLEFVNGQAGFDVPISREFAAYFGPFVGFSLGQFSHTSCSNGSAACPPIQQKSLHEWLTGGARVLFVL